MCCDSFGLGLRGFYSRRRVVGAGTGRGVHSAWAATCAAMCADGVGRGDSMGGVGGCARDKGGARWRGELAGC